MTEFERAKWAVREILEEKCTSFAFHDDAIAKIVHAVCDTIGHPIGPRRPAAVSECAQIGEHIFYTGKETCACGHRVAAAVTRGREILVEAQQFTDRVLSAIRSNALEIRGVLEQAR